MNADEYKAYCIDFLARVEDPDLWEEYREDYLSGGWSEEELTTLSKLDCLYQDSELFADSEEEEEKMLQIWLSLPVSKDLLLEVLRKRGIEDSIRILETIDQAKLTEEEKQNCQEMLERLEDDLLPNKADKPERSPKRVSESGKNRAR